MCNRLQRKTRYGQGCKFKGFYYTIRPLLKNFEGKITLTRLTNRQPMSVEESIKREDFEHFLKLVPDVPAHAEDALSSTSTGSDAETPPNHE